jgi:hypothetical protein
MGRVENTSRGWVPFGGSTVHGDRRATPREKSNPMAPLGEKPCRRLAYATTCAGDQKWCLTDEPASGRGGSAP